MANQSSQHSTPQFVIEKVFVPITIAAVTAFITVYITAQNTAESTTENTIIASDTLNQQRH